MTYIRDVTADGVSPLFISIQFALAQADYTFQRGKKYDLNRLTERERVCVCVRLPHSHVWISNGYWWGGGGGVSPLPWHFYNSSRLLSWCQWAAGWYLCSPVDCDITSLLYLLSLSLSLSLYIFFSIKYLDSIKEEKKKWKITNIAI